jgi:hypothetical protein
MTLIKNLHHGGTEKSKTLNTEEGRSRGIFFIVIKTDDTDSGSRAADPVIGT